MRQVQEMMGGYSDYKDKMAAEEASRMVEQRQSVKPSDNEPVHKPVKRISKGLTFGETKEYAEIEAVIASKESELKVVEMQMEQNATDYDQLRELTAEQQRLSDELEKLMDRWAYLEEKADEGK